MKTRLLVLAAGMGSRFGGVKQVAAVGPAGETILEYSVHDAIAAGFDEVVFLIRHSMEGDFESAVFSRLPGDLRRRIVFQEQDTLLEPADLSRAVGRTKPWGTGHALLCAQKSIGCPFAVINADDYYGSESFVLVHDRLVATDPQSSEFCMAGYGLARTTSPHGPVSRGVCVLDADGMLESIVEHVSIQDDGRGGFESISADGSRTVFSGREMVSMNLWGFTQAIFVPAAKMFRSFLDATLSAPDSVRLRAEFYLPGIVDALVGDRRASVSVLPTPEVTFGLTYREDLAETRRHLARLTAAGRYPSPLWRKP